MNLIHIKYDVLGQTSARWCGMEARRERLQLICRPRHRTAVQNYEVNPTPRFTVPLGCTTSSWIRSSRISKRVVALGCGHNNDGVARRAHFRKRVVA
ncbi:hypothetical protein AVEN_1862-1 [Araneus ventricosus]|uniref:Uncharacterized protein n=1 Tax=Araneus ventricosus TaxID=182803 RepID=A0A4Y2UQC5_ARAVE|nr:hypothetical protein AVEN_1862-1 [Araneus ventricosus]